MQPDFHRQIALSAAISLTGFVASGPLAFLLVRLIAPQPPWSSGKEFALHYHFIQDLPFYFGLLLVGGMIMLAVSHYLNVHEYRIRLRFEMLLAFGFTVVFSALITFNYVCQTTFVRHLARNYEPSHDFAIATFSMSNPLSLAWAIEMWGYAVLGIVTWLLAAYYREQPAIRGLLSLNGVVSVLGAAAAVVDVHWLLSPAGVALYFAWNVLMIVILWMIYRKAATNNNE